MALDFEKIKNPWKSTTDVFIELKFQLFPSYITVFGIQIVMLQEIKS